MARPPLDSAAILCRSLHAFARAHLAVMHAGGVSLLPTGTGDAVLRHQAETTPDLVVLAEDQDDPRIQGLRTVALDELPVHDELPCEMAPEQVVTVLFTSGSTGTPKPVAKTWAALVGEADAVGTAFGLEAGARVITTAPLEHMYAYSFAFFIPRRLGLQAPSRRVVFPADLRAEVARSSVPAWIISTPTHLKAMADAGVRLHTGIAGVVSATSRMSRQLAERVRECFGVPVSEIYGSTETGALAWRRWTGDDPVWECLPGLELHARDDDSVAVSSPYFSEPMVLSDHIELLSSTRFRLHGRTDDVIKVAGNRASLFDLNDALLSAPGVRDGAYYMPIDVSAPMVRPSAFVVLGPDGAIDDVLAFLRTRMAPVFLPRPLVEVKNLPRAASGKLSRSALDVLYQEHCLNTADCPTGTTP